MHSEGEIDRRRLASLLDAMEAQATRPGQLPRQGEVELRRFLEDLCRAVAVTIGLPSTRIDQWHVELPSKGIHLSHSAVFARIAAVWAQGNLGAHPNEEGDLISREQVIRDVATVREAVGIVAHLLRGRGFVDHFYATQESSTAQRRAQALVEAIGEALPGEAALAPVLEYARPVLGERLVKGSRIPEAWRAAWVVRELANNRSSQRQLSRLARHLHAQTGHPALEAWLQAQGAVEATEELPKLPTLAVWLTSDGGDGLVLRWAGLLHPPVPGLEEALAGLLPLPVPSLDGLTKALASVSQVVDTLLRERPGFGLELDWEQLVLQINVCPEMAHRPFEASENRLGVRLAERFRCIAVRPLLEDSRGMPVSPRLIEHPDATPSNTLRLDQPLDPRHIFHRARRRAAVFSAPWAAAADDEILPVVRAFEEHACSVVCADMPLDQALDALFPDAEPQSLGELFDGVTRLRSDSRVLLLWDDPDYLPPLPQALT